MISTLGSRTLLLPLLLASSITTSRAAAPYNPTRILQPGGSSDGPIYVFHTTPEGQWLRSFNTSVTLNASHIPYDVVSYTLPFLKTGDRVAYTPSVDEHGNITVFAGDCGNGAEGAQLWRYPATGARSWSEVPLSEDSDVRAVELAGSNFLAAGLSFSTSGDRVDMEEDVYVFGGMCPNSTAPSNDGGWATSSSYSDLMLKIAPDAKMSQSHPNYELGEIMDRGPPVAEAGMTITPLAPTFANGSDGSSARQQSFVMLGGHTQTAFINMSQIALFSLPQESWTYLAVEQPERNDADSSARVPQVDPRSGHTAVLSEDGSKIIIFGGWVGDVTQAAEPQLAVIEVGDGFGGSGKWRWTVPSPSESASGPRDSIYGHGATLLPGNVMMIIGGYSISAPDGAAKVKRQAQTTNTINFFLNVTSMTWLTEYKPSVPAESAQASAGALETASQKAGLGIGLALGIVAIVAAVVLGVLYYRRLKSQRNVRRQELMKLAMQHNRYHYGENMNEKRDYDTYRTNDTSRTDDSYETDVEVRQQAYDHHAWAQDDHVAQVINSGRHDVERTGLQLDIPSPTRGLRKGYGQRGNYQLAPHYDDNVLNRGSNIHPIDEQEEEDMMQVGTAISTDMLEETIIEDLNVFNGGAPRSRRTIRRKPVAHHVRIHSPPTLNLPLQDYKADFDHRANDWTGANAQQHAADSGSPVKSERTDSTLSERSMQSVYSSTGRSVSAPTAEAFTCLGDTQPQAHSPRTEGRFSPYHAVVSMRMTASAEPTSRPGTSESMAESFATARSPSAQGHSEREALLGPRSATTPSSFMPQRSRTGRTWMGSVRRALTGGNKRVTDRSASMTAASTAARDELRRGASSATGERVDESLEPYRDDWVTSPTSPSAETKPFPQRTVSEGASCYRGKRGAAAWDFETLAARRRAEKQKYDWGAPEDRERFADVDSERGDEGGEEWDVEAAVERRRVQVTFTVPRERLRVVNAAEGDVRSLISIEGDGGERVGGGAGAGRASGGGLLIETEGNRTLESIRKSLELEPQLISAEDFAMLNGDVERMRRKGKNKKWEEEEEEEEEEDDERSRREVDGSGGGGDGNGKDEQGWIAGGQHR